MRISKYFAAPWAALMFYATASFISGNIGLSAYEYLDAERRKQMENIAELRKVNSALVAEQDALSHDPDTIAQKAVDLGYGQNGEFYIRIEGFNGLRKQQIQAGTIFKPVDPEAIDDGILKLYAIGIFIVMLGAMGITDLLRFIRDA